jgi:hypothetical protein
MSLIFATQLTAVATVALAVLALAAAIVAGIALRKQSRELATLIEENKQQAEDRRRSQALNVFIGIPPRSNRLVQPAAYNSSSVPVFDAQFWYPGPDRMIGPDDLGMIMPGPVGLNGRQMHYDDALEFATLTFRDAEGARWIRMPDGTLKAQERGTARDSVLAAFGQSPAERGPAELPQALEAGEPSGDPADPEPQ